MTNEMIKRYLQGQLPKDEQRSFEARMQEDQALVEQVEQEKKVMIAIDLLARLKKKQQLATIAQSQSKSAKILPLSRMAAAIVLLLVIGAGYYLLERAYSNAALAEKFDERYIRSTSVQGVNNENRLRTAIDNYETGRYELALRQFVELSDSMHEHSQIQLFAGNCELKLGRYEEAIRTFRGVAQSSETFEETARWYLALAYLYADHESEAVEILNQIAENQFNYTKAQQLLRKLNSPLRRIPGI